MELFNRIKLILLNPKEEWEVIEAENKPHEKVLPYLLLLALIPAAALFFNNWWQWQAEVDKVIEAIRKETVDNGYLSKPLHETLTVVKNLFSLKFYVPLVIIKSIRILIQIVGGTYIVAVVINALSEQFGLKKDFNRSFSLVAYSFTPLCIAGVLYAYTPFAQFVPYIGLYGIYLLYLGIKPLLNPSAEKYTGCIIMIIIVTLGIYLVIPQIEKPITDGISKNMLLEQIKKAEFDGNKYFLERDIENLQDFNFDEIEKHVKNRLDRDFKHQRR